jgi:hypothetical protein
MLLLEGRGAEATVSKAAHEIINVIAARVLP